MGTMRGNLGHPRRTAPTPLATNHTPLSPIFRFQGTGIPESIRATERRHPNIREHGKNMEAAVVVGRCGSPRLPSNPPHMRWRTGPSPHEGGGGHLGRAGVGTGGGALYDPPRLLGTTSPHGEPVEVDPSHSPHGVSGRRTQTEPVGSGSPNGTGVGTMWGVG